MENIKMIFPIKNQIYKNLNKKKISIYNYYNPYHKQKICHNLSQY